MSDVAKITNNTEIKEDHWITSKIKKTPGKIFSYKFNKKKN